jgi:hypothetical protein
MSLIPSTTHTKEFQVLVGLWRNPFTLLLGLSSAAAWKNGVLKMLNVELAHNIQQFHF